MPEPSLVRDPDSELWGLTLGWAQLLQVVCLGLDAFLANGDRGATERSGLKPFIFIAPANKHILQTDEVSTTASAL